MADESACLDENAVTALLSGQLDEAEAAFVEKHVDACADCLALVAAAAKAQSIAATASIGGSASPDNDALARGTRVGRYEIVSLVGAGAMGAIYSAIDPDLHRTVALKLVRTRAGSDASERRERLLREARTMAKLAHPNVVAVHDVGTLGDRVFVAMDLVEGQTLRDWLAEPRPTKDILATFLAAGRGLAAAHAANVVHRDFKPENVLAGRDGRVLVTDFGLALDPESDDERPGTVAGTPAYMAPEQLRGDEVDARADQFSFCVALHEALAGERPFRGRRPSDLLAAIEAQTFEDARSAPAHVRRALRRGLARTREARFPSMAALLDELSRDPAARVRRVGAAALGVIALVAAGAAGTSSVQRERMSCRDGVVPKVQAVWGPAQRASIHDAFTATKLPYAEDAWRRVSTSLDGEAASWTAMHTEACDATHVRAEQSAELLDLRVACLGDHLGEMRTLVDVLSHADADVVKNAAAAVNALAPLRRCADAFALRAVAPPPADRAEAARTLRLEIARAKALCDAGHVNESLELARAASKASADLGYEPLTARALLRLGEAETEARHAEAASETLWQAEHVADRAKDDYARAHALTRRLYVEGFLLRHAERIPELDEAAAAAIARLGGDLELEGHRRHSLGMGLVERGSLVEAAVAFEEAVKLREKAHGAKSREVAKSRNGLCLVASKRNDPEKTLKACKSALDLWTEILGPKHPDVALGMSNVGAALGDLDRYDEASAMYEASLEISEPALGADHPLVAITLSNLGDSLSKRGDHGRAIAVLLRARRIRESLPESSEPFTEVVLTNLGQAYLRAGDLPKARETLEDALQRVSQRTTPATRAEIALGLASALWGSGERASRQRARRIVGDATSLLPADARSRRDLDAWLAAHP